jgi:hypothetical protein
MDGPPGHIPCSVMVGSAWSDPAPASILQGWGRPQFTMTTMHGVGEH